MVFEPVRFVKLNAIAAAALDFAKTGAEIALGLIGVLALFLGLLKIAEDSGIVFALVKLVRPILRPLFPRDPARPSRAGHDRAQPHRQLFGLGNAATPFGIKAMEELQKLNPSEDTATNSMVMLLAINTASVQLVPPVLLLALMGTPDQHADLPDPDHDRAGADRRHRRREAARPAARLSRVRPQPPASAGLRPAMDTARNAISLLSYFVIPLMLVGFPLYGLYKRVPVYESFVEGAQGGIPGRGPDHSLPGRDPLRHRDVPGQRRDGGADAGARSGAGPDRLPGRAAADGHHPLALGLGLGGAGGGHDQPLRRGLDPS